MPAKKRLTMRQSRQMLRLAGSGTSSHEIAVVLGVARSTVQDNLKQAALAGLTWPLPGDALEHRLFARAGVRQGQRRRQEPVWSCGTMTQDDRFRRQNGLDFGRFQPCRMPPTFPMMLPT